MISTIKEALNELNKTDIDILLVKYFKDVFYRYAQKRDELNKIKGKQARLRYSGYNISNSDVGYIKSLQRELDIIKTALPEKLHFESLFEVYKTLSTSELNTPLTQEEKHNVKEYVNQRDNEKTDLIKQLPRIGQRFRFSYVPVTYVALEYDGDELVYTSDDSDPRKWRMNIEYFLEQKNNYKVTYYDR